VCAHVRVPALRSYRWLKRSTRIPMRALPKGALGASQPGGQREEAQKRFGHDGQPYTFEEFLQQYGNPGRSLWIYAVHAAVPSDSPPPVLVPDEVRCAYDGKSYTWKEFVDFYGGLFGSSFWIQAAQGRTCSERFLDTQRRAGLVTGSGEAVLPTPKHPNTVPPSSSSSSSSSSSGSGNVVAPTTVASQHGAKTRLNVFKQHLKQQTQQRGQQHSSRSQVAPKTRPSMRPPVREVVPPNPQESHLAQQQHVDRMHQLGTDEVAEWVMRFLPRLQGKNQHNFAKILRMARIRPDLDFAGVMESPYSIAPKRGVHYYRIFTAEGRGWQRSTAWDERPGCQYYSGGHGTTDSGLLHILRDRALKPGKFVGVYGYLTEGAFDPEWGEHYFTQCMEKVASHPKNAAGVVIEVRCRGVSKRIIGGITAECKAVSQGIIAHASRRNHGRWLMPVPFIDFVALWVPLHGFCGDTLPGCLTPIPGLPAV